MSTHDASRKNLAGTLLLPSLLAIVSLITTLTLPNNPAPGLVAAVFPPWWGEGRSLLAAASSGSVIRFGAVPFVVIVAPENAVLIPQLRRAGAWLILDPLAFGGCLGTV